MAAHTITQAEWCAISKGNCLFSPFFFIQEVLARAGSHPKVQVHQSTLVPGNLVVKLANRLIYSGSPEQAKVVAGFFRALGVPPEAFTSF